MLGTVRTVGVEPDSKRTEAVPTEGGVKVSVATSSQMYFVFASAVMEGVVPEIVYCHKTLFWMPNIF